MTSTNCHTSPAVSVINRAWLSVPGPLSRSASNGATTQAERMVTAAGADLGVIFSPTAERLTLIDERGRVVPDERSRFVWHAEPQYPGVAHSHPSVSGATVLQSERSAAHT